MTQLQTGNRTPSKATTGTVNRGGPAKTPAPPKTGPNFTLILIALGLGLLTVVITNWYIHQVRAQVESQRMTLYKLNHPVEPGDKLSERDYTSFTIPATEEVQAHYIQGLGAFTAEEIENRHGQRFKRYANTSALLTHSLFTEEGRNAAGGPDLRDGYRGVTLEVDRSTAPPILRPQMVVDLSGYLNIRGKGEKERLVMERVRVLAVGGQTSATASNRDRGYSDITVEVLPAEARALKTIAARLPDNEFTIVIRSKIDDELEIETGSINPELVQAYDLDLGKDE